MNIDRILAPMIRGAGQYQKGKRDIEEEEFKRLMNVMGLGSQMSQLNEPGLFDTMKLPQGYPSMPSGFRQSAEYGRQGEDVNRAYTAARTAELDPIMRTEEEMRQKINGWYDDYKKETDVEDLENLYNKIEEYRPGMIPKESHLRKIEGLKEDKIRGVKKEDLDIETKKQGIKTLEQLDREKRLDESLMEYRKRVTPEKPTVREQQIQNLLNDNNITEIGAKWMRKGITYQQLQENPDKYPDSIPEKPPENELYKEGIINRPTIAPEVKVKKRIGW